MESRIQNRILKSGIQPLRESRIHGWGIRNPQTRNPESTTWNPQSKTLLDYLIWGDDLCQYVWYQIFTPRRPSVRFVSQSFTLISCELYLSSPFVFPLFYKAGIIDLGNDTIYIEPVLNTSLIIHRGWTRPGRPHLVYRKAMLDSNEQHDLALDQFVGSGGYPTGLNGLYKIVTNYTLTVVKDPPVSFWLMRRCRGKMKRPSFGT